MGGQGRGEKGQTCDLARLRYLLPVHLERGLVPWSYMLSVPSYIEQKALLTAVDMTELFIPIVRFGFRDEPRPVSHVCVG